MIKNGLMFARQWDRIGVFSHHGILVPLSALHSKNSCGVGEFFDLLPLLDFCAALKLTILQLLPLNDSGDDPSPYNSVSTCALNPLFLSLHALPDVDDLRQEITKLQMLTQSSRIQWKEVQQGKLDFLHKYCALAGKKITKSAEFTQFLHAHPWINHYALFKTIKKKISNHIWTSWPIELQKNSPDLLEKIGKEYPEELDFHRILQYLCYQQLKQVKEVAEKKKIMLLGDLPILLSPDSADVWHYQEFFNLNLQAGSRPDQYNEEGQAWGFPIMRWDKIKEDGYSIWKERLNYAAHFYHLYRIDHVIGLFRIWAIPVGHPSKDGAYIPSDQGQWLHEGETHLAMLARNCTMLPIAEDLGDVLPSIRASLKKCGVCGTKVMRWERNWESDKSFIPVQEYDPLSLTTVSTHDSETLTLWWRDSPDEAAAFAGFKHWEYRPTLSFAERKEILWDSHHSGSLFHINLLQEYLALFPELVAENPEMERINIPGTFKPSNWSYRFRPSVEELLTHDLLMDQMRSLI